MAAIPIVISTTFPKKPYNRRRVGHIRCMTSVIAYRRLNVNLARNKRIMQTIFGASPSHDTCRLEGWRWKHISSGFHTASETESCTSSISVSPSPSPSPPHRVNGLTYSLDFELPVPLAVKAVKRASIGTPPERNSPLTRPVSHSRGLAGILNRTDHALRSPAYGNWFWQAKHDAGFVTFWNGYQLRF